MSVFDEIKTGLQQAIAFEQGRVKANTRTVSIVPVELFTATEIKEIRKSTGLTQNLFAQFMGVSQKTVEAWEAGRNQPNGTACRMLSLTKKDPHFPRDSGILT